jgi:hypothetical protein
MRFLTSGLLLLTALATPALADLKPDIVDCNAKKAARNASMKATVGVSGVCDPGKMVDDAKDDAKDRVDDTRDNVGDKVDDVLDGDDKRDHKLRKD